MRVSEEQKKNAQEYDVVIVGSGMVGASLIHMLAHSIRNGMRVALVERYPLQGVTEAPPSFDGRATALSWNTRQMLSRIGVWPHIRKHACPILDISVSDKGRLPQAHLSKSDSSAEALGYVVRNQHLGQGLLSGLDELATVYAPAEVTELRMISGGGALSLGDGTQLKARLVVLADGGRSGLADSLGIRSTRKDYAAHAVVTSVRMDRPHNNRAYERFTMAGPLAMLPLGTHDFAVVKTTEEDQTESILAMTDKEFCELLHQDFGYRAGRILECGERASYPLAMTTANEQIRPHLVLLGNAAHSLHPVAGQGFNLALRDTAALAQYMNECFAVTPEQMGNWDMLQSYLRQQEADQRNTLFASDALPGIFSQASGFVKAVRGAGLAAMSVSPTARRLFVRHAMGMGQTAARITTGDRS